VVVVTGEVVDVVVDGVEVVVVVDDVVDPSPPEPEVGPLNSPKVMNETNEPIVNVKTATRSRRRRQ